MAEHRRQGPRLTRALVKPAPVAGADEGVARVGVEPPRGRARALPLLEEVKDQPHLGAGLARRGREARRLGHEAPGFVAHERP